MRECGGGHRVPEGAIVHVVAKPGARVPVRPRRHPRSALRRSHVCAARRVCPRAGGAGCKALPGCVAHPLNACSRQPVPGTTWLSAGSSGTHTSDEVCRVTPSRWCSVRAHGAMLSPDTASSPRRQRPAQRRQGNVAEQWRRGRAGALSKRRRLTTARALSDRHHQQLHRPAAACICQGGRWKTKFWGEAQRRAA
jgi:hypothetical protein